MHNYISLLFFAVSLVGCGAAKPGDRRPTGPTDSGSTDTGPTDSGSTDTGPTDTGSTDTGPTDTGPTDTGSTDTGPTDTGVTIVSNFTCTEISLVDPPMKVEIVGGFDAAGVPHDLVSTLVQSGAVDFSVADPQPVAPGDPYAADVDAWEAILSMVGWDVNMGPGGDRRYVFFPSGAQGVSTFDAFYYRIYASGGNGQFEFRCVSR